MFICSQDTRKDKTSARGLSKFLEQSSEKAQVVEIELLTDKRMKAQEEAVLPLHSKMGQEILKKTSGEPATE